MSSPVPRPPDTWQSGRRVTVRGDVDAVWELTPAERLAAWRPTGGRMQCCYPAVCPLCLGAVDVGQWQVLAAVPGDRRRWVHEGCAHPAAESSS